MRRLFSAALAVMTAGALFAAEEESAPYPRNYLSLAGSLVLPPGGSRLNRLGGAALRGGHYLSESFALEAEAAWLENRCALAVRSLIHFSAWEEFDLLFGCERLSPFFTVGARVYFPSGQVGPEVGVGALYYLTDEWALRGEAGAVLGLDTRVETVYSLSLGLQYSF